MIGTYQIVTAVGFMVLAAVAMVDSRAGALVDRTGSEPGGIGAGFYPFWSAGLVLVFAAAVAYRTWTTPQPLARVFEGREQVIAVLKLIIPMLVATLAIPKLGFYFVTALYMGLFARWIGRYPWIWVASVTILMPTAIYAAFELGFRVSLPKSFLYDAGVLPF